MRIVRRLTTAVLTTTLSSLALCLVASLPAQAAGADRVDLTYRVFVGGLPVVEVDTSTTIDGDRYRMDGLARTVGMWESLFTARMASRVDGRMEADGSMALPMLYQTRYDGVVGDKRSINVTFGKDGPTQVSVEPPNTDDNRRQVEPEFLIGTLDPATAAILATGTNNGAAICTQEFKVFDGRRRYDVAFENMGQDEVFAGNDERFYGGMATRCTISYRRVKGFDPDWERTNASKFPNKFDIWFVQFEGLPRPIPVKVQVKTDYGVVVAQLISRGLTKTDSLGAAAQILPPPDLKKMGG